MVDMAGLVRINSAVQNSESL